MNRSPDRVVLLRAGAMYPLHTIVDPDATPERDGPPAVRDPLLVLVVDRTAPALVQGDPVLTVDLPA